MSQYPFQGSKKQGTNSKVFSIFTGKPLSGSLDNPIIRLAPENDGVEMLYTNRMNPEKIYCLKVACWALRANGDIHGLVPWLGELMPCDNIQDPLDGCWQGYRQSGGSEIFLEVPAYKSLELRESAKHFSPLGAKAIASQTIPNTIGTHAALTENDFKSLTLVEVHSWRLTESGEVHGMIATNENSDSVSRLGNDEGLQSASKHPHFRYFFQHHVANKIKNQDPDAMLALSRLSDKKQ